MVFSRKQAWTKKNENALSKIIHLLQKFKDNKIFPASHNQLMFMAVQSLTLKPILCKHDTVILLVLDHEL